MGITHPLDLAAPLCFAAVTFGALALLTPSRARARPLPPAPTRALTAGPATWQPPPRAPQVSRLARSVTRRPTRGIESGDQALVDGRGLRGEGEADVGVLGIEDGSGVREYFFDDMFYGHSGGYRGYHRYGRRYVRRQRAREQQPMTSWIDASQGGSRVSLCELLPSLCATGSGVARTGLPRLPESQETPARVAISNEHVSLDMDRVGRCVVRVRRAEDRADTLLTFDTPDTLVPCEARLVPDLLHEDGVAVRLDAQTPRWSQSVTVSLGAGDVVPGVSIARARRDGAATTHELVNGTDARVVFTVDDADFSADPGEALTVTGG